MGRHTSPTGAVQKTLHYPSLMYPTTAYALYGLLVFIARKVDSDRAFPGSQQSHLRRIYNFGWAILS